MSNQQNPSPATKGQKRLFTVMLLLITLPCAITLAKDSPWLAIAIPLACVMIGNAVLPKVTSGRRPGRRR